MPIEAQQRPTRERPCPICGGYPNLPQGQGSRCAGFSLDRVAYCTRDEHAGTLPLDIRTSPPAYCHMLLGSCGCGRQHGWDAVRLLPPVPPAPRAVAMPLADRDAVYRDLLDLLPLQPAALADLTRRGLSADAAREAGYRSIPHRGQQNQNLIRELTRRHGEKSLAICPGFTDKNGRRTFWTAYGNRDGYVIPYIDEEDRITGLQVRLFHGGYRTLRGTSLEFVYHVSGYVGADRDLYVTEGATKANVATALAGLPVFAVAGQSLKDTHVQAITRLEPARVIVALDQEGNANTARARERWASALAGAGLPVFVAVWEGADVGGPKGIDDLLHQGGRPRLRPVGAAPSGIGRARVLRPASEPGPVADGSTIEAARAATTKAVSTFIQERPRGRALLVATPPGTGKTTAVGAALKRRRFGARIVVGTERLAKELATAFDYHLIQGRNPQNCTRIPVVDALGARGNLVAKLACGTIEEPRCPDRGICPYWKQFDVPAAWVGAAEQIFNPHFLRGGTLLVVDDADPLRSLIERLMIAAADIDRAIAHPALAGRRDARHVLQVIRHALIDTEGTIAGPDAWDRLARSAAQGGQDLATLVGRLPKNPTMPQPTSSGPLHVEDVDRVPPQTLLRLFAALRDELHQFRSGEPFNSRIRISRDGVEIRWLREHVRPRNRPPTVADMAVLVLDATPVDPLVDHLTGLHHRLPDVAVRIRLPDNVTVVQYAGSTNGHTVLRDDARRDALLREVQAERDAYPVERPEHEGAVGFLRLDDSLGRLGIASKQVLHFGNVRGSNALAEVRRLHLVGRPMPPSDEIYPWLR